MKYNHLYISKTFINHQYIPRNKENGLKYISTAGVLDNKDLHILTSLSSSKDIKNCFFCFKKVIYKDRCHLEIINSNKAGIKKFSLLPKKCRKKTENNRYEFDAISIGKSD